MNSSSLYNRRPYTPQGTEHNTRQHSSTGLIPGMLAQIRHTKRFLQVAALAIFTIQLTFAFLKFFSKPSMTLGETRDIMSLNSPILVTVCKLDQIDLKSSSKIGYHDEIHYYSGKAGNSSYLSWTGNGTMAPNDTLNQVFDSEMANIGTKKGSSWSGMRIVIPYGKCKHIEEIPKNILINTTSWKNVFPIYIHDSNSKYQVFVSDPRAAPKFQLPKPLMTGAKIIAQPTETNKIHYYNIIIKEIRNELDDGSCAPYPDTEGHQTFTACVEAENNGIILPVLGCLPPWLSDSSACTAHIRNSTDKKDLSLWFYKLYQRSKMGFHYKSASCLPSCRHLAVHSVLQDIKTGSGQTKSPNKINLFFESIVQVERIIPAYGIGSLLVEVGSSLGLWLGLSVVGIFDVMVSICLKITFREKPKDTIL